MAKSKKTSASQDAAASFCGTVREIATTCENGVQSDKSAVKVTLLDPNGHLSLLEFSVAAAHVARVREAFHPQTTVTLPGVVPYEKCRSLLSTEEISVLRVEATAFGAEKPKNFEFSI
jgi:hypothetical protein